MEELEQIASEESEIYESVFYAKKNNYFKPQDWERWKDGLVYKCLGVDFFKTVVPTQGRIISKIFDLHPIRKAENKEEGLKEYEPWTRLYETVHLVGGSICTIANGMIFIDKGIEEALPGIIANLAVNIYPVMLQRYNRAMIYNALEKIEEEKQEE